MSKKYKEYSFTKFNIKILTIIILIFVNTSIVQAKSVAEYLPGDHIYNVDVPTPGKSLGFELGQRHPRHDQVLAYLQTLALSSERVKLTEIGLTTELRKQVLLTISHPDNLANLEHILQQRKITSFGTKTTEEQKQSKTKRSPQFKPQLNHILSGVC